MKLPAGAPLVSFGREVCGDLDAALQREWLVTNGLGGYTSGSVGGTNTRRYHGLLVAALSPPVSRTVLVSGTVEWALYDGERYPLSTHEYAGGTVDPQGYRHLAEFRLEGTLPVWTYRFADVVLERRIWMENGANTSWLAFRQLQGSLDVAVEVVPLVTYRDFHALTSGQGWSLDVAHAGATVTVQAFDGAHPFYMTADRGEFRPGSDWYWNFHRRAEAARGLDDREDLYAAGTFAAALSLGEQLAIRMSTLEPDNRTAGDSLTAEQGRQTQALERAGALGADLFTQQLILAADQFIVERHRDGAAIGKTVIAGYHWFNDWGRDTMIALPGLTLSTGRESDAANILRTFARYVSEGMLPNNFPDHDGDVPGYNTVDATLWYVLAVRAHAQATGDTTVQKDLLPVLQEIVERHISGTRYGIGVDPADGLLRAGEPGVQLTWMDARIGDWVVTPRIGKPVEINALWYNALKSLAEMLAPEDPAFAAELEERAGGVAAAFRQRFFSEERGYLADVVDGPDGDDWTFRPNQILAVSLPFPVLEGHDAKQVVDSVGRKLLTDFGLRSLDPDHPDYHPAYGGDPLTRDGGYHQGPVWNWLAGPFAEAHLRVYGDPDAARRILAPLAHHLFDAGLGTISEIQEGAAPHAPRGCIAQAWSVAETLRVLRLLESYASS